MELKTGNPSKYRDRSQLIAVKFSIVLTLGAAIALFYEANRKIAQVHANAEHRGTLLFASLSPQLADGLHSNNIDIVRKESEILIASNLLQRIAIFSKTGSLLLDSSQTETPNGSIDSALLSALKATATPLNRWTNHELEFIGTIDIDGVFNGGLLLHLDIREQLLRARKSLREHQTLGGLLVLLASGLAFALTREYGANRSLKILESQFRKMVEQSPVPTSIFQTDGALVYSNPAFADLISRSPAVAQGQPYNLFTDPSFSEPAVGKLLRQGFSTRPTRIPMFPLNPSASETADQADTWLRSVIFPLRDAQNDITNVVGIFEDVSATKQAEKERAELNAQILQSQKLEELGVMAGGIAHDFNNLLTPAQGNAELLGRKLPATSELRPYVDGILLAVNRAAGLCDQLLAYAGAGSGLRSPIDISREVTELNDIMRAALAKKTVVKESLATDLPLVLADQTQLRQVILNLLINASEALEGDVGEVRIRTGVTTLTEQAAATALPSESLSAGQYVFLEVTDSGIGMSEETQRSLFNPFYSTKFTGRGLGMSTVLAIVRDHAGGVRVVSDYGKGSKITVYFPIKEVLPAKQDDISELLTMEHSGLVLLADDDKAALLIGKEILTTLGFDVVTAGDGAEALQLFRANRNKLCCVILDLLMPELDGEEALTEIRQLDAETPIVIVSGFTAGRKFRHLARLPNVFTLKKPYKIDDLQRILSDAVPA